MGSLRYITFLICWKLLFIQSCVFAETETKKELNCSAVVHHEEPQTEDMASTDTFDYKKATSIYDFTVKDTYGNDVSLEKYRGYVVLIVNIASQCGLTKSNYEKLTELRNKYYDKGLRILGFPCNQFSSQMPENDGDEMICHLKKANADFGDIFQKIDVNGDNAIPLYKYLKEQQNGIFGKRIKWNFTKFLIDKNGHPVDRFAPTTSDLSKDIEKLL